MYIVPGKRLKSNRKKQGLADERYLKASNSFVKNFKSIANMPN